MTGDSSLPDRQAVLDALDAAVAELVKRIGVIAQANPKIPIHTDVVKGLAATIITGASGVIDAVAAEAMSVVKNGCGVVVYSDADMA